MASPTARPIVNAGIVVSKLADVSDDREYWWRQTADDRLAAVETMRQTLYGYDPAPGRLQRLLRLQARRVDALIDGLPVPVIDLASLRRNKKASGRFKDLDDLENLPVADEETES